MRLLLGVLIAVLVLALAASAEEPAGPVADALNGLELLAAVATLFLGLWTWFKGSAWFRVCRQERYAAALQALEAGVELTYRTYVRSIKESRADGKLTLEEMRQARAHARSAAIEFGRTRGVNVLTEIGADYVDLTIAKAVKRLKGTKATELVLEERTPQ